MAAKVFESIRKFRLALAVTGGVVNSALYNVDAGHRAAIFDQFSGVQDIVVGEGTHFLIPWVQKPIISDCRSRPRNVPVITGSQDVQNVNITVRILFRPVASQLPRIYTSIGEDYVERVLPSITADILKSVVARFDAGALITQRESWSPGRAKQQEAERARLVVEKAEQKKAAVISTEDDPKAVELITNLIELRKLEAAEDSAYQLSRSRNIT